VYGRRGQWPPQPCRKAMCGVSCSASVTGTRPMASLWSRWLTVLPSRLQEPYKLRGEHRCFSRARK
jgi:hypothetical protein